MRSSGTLSTSFEVESLIGCPSQSGQPYFHVHVGNSRLCIHVYITIINLEVINSKGEYRQRCGRSESEEKTMELTQVWSAYMKLSKDIYKKIDIRTLSYQ